ncbi:MAG TPA: hypothetical protein VFE90_06050 [Myxococcales bacterium]|jgi:hypothetical protein|nr:hypothetical protein [Myxococcales bacterium]
MKWILALMLVGAVVLATTFVPPKTAAKMTARGLRATWDWLAGLGQEQRTPPAPTRKTVRKAQARRTGREGIVAQPPKERLGDEDRASLDALIGRNR